MPDQSYYDLRSRLLTEFPEAFGTLEEPRALALGFTHQLAEHVPAPDHFRFMRIWTSRMEYRQIVARGGPRYNLDGTIDGEISDEHRTHAVGMVAARILRRMNAPDDGGRVLGMAELDHPRNAPIRHGLLVAADRLARSKWPKSFGRRWPCRSGLGI